MFSVSTAVLVPFGRDFWANLRRNVNSPCDKSSLAVNNTTSRSKYVEAPSFPRPQLTSWNSQEKIHCDQWQQFWHDLHAKEQSSLPSRRTKTHFDRDKKLCSQSSALVKWPAGTLRKKTIRHARVYSLEMHKLGGTPAPLSANQSSVHGSLSPWHSSGLIKEWAAHQRGWRGTGKFD